MAENQTGIPSEIRSFISRHIRSVGHLEVVLLMAGSPEKTWTAEEISRELRSNPTYADAQLRNLLSSGAVVSHQNGGKKYHLSSSLEILIAVQWLKENFNQRRSSLITFIYSQPIEKIRDLADAFVFGKE